MGGEGGGFDGLPSICTKFSVVVVTGSCAREGNAL